MTLHRLATTRETATDVLSRDLDPVLTVDPGDEIVVETLDASGHLEPQRTPGEERPLLLPARRGHCLVGPIAVRGAEPGDLLALHLRELVPASWGWTVAGAAQSRVTRMLGLEPGERAALLWEIDPSAGTATERRGPTVPIAPFLGVMGTAPAEPGEHSTIPPRPGTGGNIDCRELVAGSVLHLPVQAPGALLFLGDGHAAQGDGEVGGTAIECGMTTRLRVEVVRDRPLDSVHAETAAGRIAFGFDEDLNAATGAALAAMVRWLTVLLGVDRATALAFASAAADLRVTQIANRTWGVHALLPPGRLV